MKTNYILPLLLITTSILFSSGCTKNFEDLFNTNDNSSNEELAERYFYISAENLNGWDQGYTDGNNYILGAHIPDSDSTIFMISSANKPQSYCYFLFEEDNSLIGLGTEENWITSFEGECKIYLCWFDENNAICGDYIELNTQDNNPPATKSTSTDILFDYDKMSKITSVIGYIQNSDNINKHKIEKEYGLLAKDITSLSVSIILDLLKASAKLNIGLFLGEIWIDGFVSTHYQRFQLALYNECTTEITEINNDGNGNINVFVTIKNSDSIPTELVRLYYPINEDITNTVYCGIVGREEIYPTSVVYTEPYKEEGLLDRNWGKERYLMYTFPIPTLAERYVFRSYLKSTRIKNDKGVVNNGYIKYSNPFYYNNVGFIDQFKQESYTINDGYYSFKCKAHASIESLNTIEWGIYHSIDNYYFPEKFYPKNYSEPSISSPNKAEFEFELRYPIEDFENNSYKYIKLGVFSYDINNNLTIWGNPQQFVLEVTKPMTSISVHVSEPKELGDERFSQKFDITCDKLSDNYHLIVPKHNSHYMRDPAGLSWEGGQIDADEIETAYNLSGSNLFNTITCEFYPIYDNTNSNPTYRDNLIFIPCIYDDQRDIYIISENPIIKEIAFPAILPEYSFIGTLNGWDIHNSTMHFSHSGNSGYDNPTFSIGLTADVWYDDKGNPHPIPIEFKVFPTKYNSWGHELGRGFFGLGNSETDNIILEGKFTYYVTMNMKERTISWR